jgi:hypothetical protein
MVDFLDVVKRTTEQMVGFPFSGSVALVVIATLWWLTVRNGPKQLQASASEKNQTTD